MNRWDACCVILCGGEGCFEVFYCFLELIGGIVHRIVYDFLGLCHCSVEVSQFGVVLVSGGDDELAALGVECAEVVAVGNGATHACGVLHQRRAAAHGSHRCVFVFAGIGLRPVVVAEDDGVAGDVEVLPHRVGVLQDELAEVGAVGGGHFLVEHIVDGIWDEHSLEDALVAAGPFVAQDVAAVGAASAGEGIIKICIGQRLVFVFHGCGLVGDVV